MEHQEIAIRFADLRRVAAVPSYVRNALGVSEPITLHSAIEDDFGIYGLDTETLLTQFGEHYRVDLSQFDFTDCISDETTEFPGLAIPVFASAKQAPIGGR